MAAAAVAMGTSAANGGAAAFILVNTKSIGLIILPEHELINTFNNITSIILLYVP